MTDYPLFLPYNNNVNTLPLNTNNNYINTTNLNPTNQINNPTPTSNVNSLLDNDFFAALKRESTGAPPTSIVSPFIPYPIDKTPNTQTPESRPEEVEEKTDEGNSDEYFSEYEEDNEITSSTNNNNTEKDTAKFSEHEISSTSSVVISESGFDPKLRKLLASLHLGKYESKFEDEEITFADLTTFTGDDFKEMGLPIGPRKRLLNAIKRVAEEENDDDTNTNSNSNTNTTNTATNTNTNTNTNTTADNNNNNNIVENRKTLYANFFEKKKKEPV